MDALTRQATSSPRASENHHNFWTNALLILAIIAMFLPFIVGLFLPAH